MHVQFSLLMTVISLSCKGVTAWRYWKERSVWANSSLTRACGHSCRHSSKGHPGLTMPPIKLYHWTLCTQTDMCATYSTVIANTHYTQLSHVLLQRTYTLYQLHLYYTFIYLLFPLPIYLDFSFWHFSLKERLLSTITFAVVLNSDTEREP